MERSRLVRAGTPLEVTVLAAMCAVLGGGCLLAGTAPMADGSPRTLLGVIGAGAALAAACLLRAGPQLPRPALHAGVVALILLRGVLVAAAVSERGQTMATLGYCWTAVYVAFFFRAELARAYGLLISATLGGALVLARAPADVSVWIWMSATSGIAIAVLTHVNATLREGARRDPLTGLLNRAGMELAAARVRAAAERDAQVVTLVMIDLDDFKGVNDRDGHAAGDELLVAISAAWLRTLRDGDVLARHGGDEFVLLLPGTGSGEVGEVLRRLTDAHPARWTAGVAACPPGEPLEAAVGRADAALYHAKAARRLVA